MLLSTIARLFIHHTFAIAFVSPNVPNDGSYCPLSSLAIYNKVYIELSLHIIKYCAAFQSTQTIAFVQPTECVIPYALWDPVHLQCLCSRVFRKSHRTHCSPFCVLIPGLNTAALPRTAFIQQSDNVVHISLLKYHILLYSGKGSFYFFFFIVVDIQ